jgi:hypothetical protein
MNAGALVDSHALENDIWAEDVSGKEKVGFHDHRETACKKSV